MNNSLNLILNTTTKDFKYAYCYDYLKERCVNAGYNQLINQNETIIFLCGVIILLIAIIYYKLNK